MRPLGTETSSVRAHRWRHTRPSDGRWNLIVDVQGVSGVENMAADEALLDDAARSRRASLRLYRWDPPTLSVGRNHSLDGLAHGIPIVRRGDAFLQHGSILIDGTQPSSGNGETTLAAVLGRSVSFGEVADAIIKTWSEAAAQSPDVASIAAE